MMHTDAVQVAGKLPLRFADTGARLMTLSAHKIYGPKGVGALIFDKTVEISPLQIGGGQEKGYRSGTENLPGIVGFGQAAELAAAESMERQAHLLQLRNQLEQGLAEMSQVTVFGAEAERLPNTVQLSVQGIDGEALLMQLDRDGIAVSSGSACASGHTEPSHVLMAMGVDELTARGAIRISVGRTTKKADIERLLASLRQQIAWVEKAAGAAAW
jgi:cysteine desulfurase